MSTDEYLDDVEWTVDDQGHITVDNGDCEDCSDKPCLHLCPAECFDHQEERQGEIYFSYEHCIECGACLVFCGNDPDKGAVSWTKPEGGKGVEYDFG
ncbi:4Fe-4S dicluster domain-containing protein [Haloarculaceae archaeon H-GB1-1]|nr:4Fe-4S dicluster domain-containing protein [Haloarculaceae archaeon H-GB1-1]